MDSRYSIAKGLYCIVKKCVTNFQARTLRPNRKNKYVLGNGSENVKYRVGTHNFFQIFFSGKK